MATWKGSRKALTILAFVAPTIIGLLIFNVYPILFNTYISFTNRNQFHPNPNCEDTLSGLIVPDCWGIFEGSAPRGRGQPYTIEEPFYSNYANLVGDLFTSEALLAMGRLVLLVLPLFVASQVNKHFGRQVTRPVSSLVVWLIAGAAVMLLWLLVDPAGAVDILNDTGDFFVVVFRTILYVLFCIPLFFIVGLLLALILNEEHIRWRTFWRSVMIVPWAASTMAVMMSLIWQFFFRERGTVNQLLAQFDLDAVRWLNDPTYAFAIVVLVNVWYSYPFFFNTILGSLQSIPQDQYEAAEIDGANYWHKLTNITLPLIRPAVLPAVVLSSITTFQMFGTVWAITAGGPTRGAGETGYTEFVMIYAYKQVFQLNAYAKAGAFAVIIFAMLFLATIYSMRMTRITKGAYE